MRHFFLPDEPTCDATALAFAPDGRTLFVGSRERVAAYDVRSGEVRWEVGSQGEVVRLDTHPKGGLLAASGDDNTVVLHDTYTGSRLYEDEVSDDAEEPAYGAFVDAGRTLVLVGSGELQTAPITDVAAVTRHHWPAGACLDVARTPDGSLLAVAHLADLGLGGWVLVFSFWRPTGDAPEGPEWPFAGNLGLVALAPDGRTVALASGREGRPSELELREVGGRAKLRTLDAGGAELTALAFSPDGRRLLAAALDGTVFLWDTGTGELRQRYHWGLRSMTSVAFAPDGLTAAAGGTGAGGRAVLWDVAD